MHRRSFTALICSTLIALLAFMTQAAVAAEAVETPTDAALYLSFDQPSTQKNGPSLTVKDLSGNNNHANGEHALIRPGKFGDALVLGGDGYLIGSDNALASGDAPSTISLWFNPDNHNFNGLFAYGTRSAKQARGLATLRGGELLCMFCWSIPAAKSKHPQLALNTWHHLVVVCQDQTLQATLNGQALPVEQLPAETVLNEYVVGANLHHGNKFSGLIDEVQVFNRALSAAEIQALYKQ